MRTTIPKCRFDQLQQDLEQTREELAQTRSELEYERERHKRRSDYVDKFAHELRNPMVPVLCAVKIMSMRGDTTGERERGIIERQITRLVELVDDFVNTSHLIFERTGMQKSCVEIDDVVRRATRLAEEPIEEREHRLHVDVAQSGLSLDADPDHLADALAKMLENAAIYTSEGGNIWLRAVQEADSVTISVRDDGSGVDPSVRDGVFEMFVQGEAGRSIKGRGMGLGLAVVRKIAELHGGQATICSDDNQKDAHGRATGSEFVMRLPLVSPT